MIQMDRRLAIAAGGGVVMGFLLSLAVSAPGRASGDALARQQAETLAALTAGVESVEARIGAVDAHLEGIGTKAREIDTIVGSLSAAFSMGDPKLTALYARMAALEEALGRGDGLPAGRPSRGIPRLGRLRGAAERGGTGARIGEGRRDPGARP
jgi:hypothetical protein